VAFELLIDVGADEVEEESILIPLPFVEDALTLLIAVPFELYTRIPFARSSLPEVGNGGVVRIGVE